MIVAIAIFLALIPAIAVIYPFLRRFLSDELVFDESSPELYLLRLWESALSNIRNIELEWSIGNLSKDDYIFLRRKSILNVAVVIQNMELHENKKIELIEKIKHEIQKEKILDETI
tara:strand:- start:111 stop:458 length:348 start_codon:yes stop_codon:yes gene_type:complete